MVKCPNCGAPMQGNSCLYCHYTAPIEKNNVSENDIIMTLGAGTVTKIGPMLAD